MSDSKVIAECIATSGYGTCCFDEETCECQYECYASVDEVISNKEYWSSYEDCMSGPLNADFNLGFNFDRFRLKVFEDGHKDAIRIG